MDPVERLLERLMRGVQLLLAIGFLVAVLLNFAGVLGRYVFGWAIVGGDEIQIFIMVWMAFLGAAVVTWREQHLRMDVLFGYLPRAAKLWIRAVEAVVLVLLAGVVVWESAGYVRQMLSINRRSDAAGIPMAIPHSAVTAGFAIILAVALLRFAQMVLQKRVPGGEGHGMQDQGAPAGAREGEGRP